MCAMQPAFACDLGALSVDDGARRATLASMVSARFREVQDIPDGYAARLDPDAALVREALDWLLLERRCCPFLGLDLSFEPSDGSVWLRFRGSPGVKEFLSAAGFKASVGKP